MLEGCAVLAERCVVNDVGSDAGRACNQKSAGLRLFERTARSRLDIFLSVAASNQRRHIRAAARNEGQRPLAAHASPKIEFAVVDTALSPNILITLPSLTGVSPPA